MQWIRSFSFKKVDDLNKIHIFKYEVLNEFGDKARVFVFFCFSTEIKCLQQLIIRIGFAENQFTFIASGCLQYVSDDLKSSRSISSQRLF
jgi:hypothetical protein